MLTEHLITCQNLLQNELMINSPFYESRCKILTIYEEEAEMAWRVANPPLQCQHEN